MNNKTNQRPILILVSIHIFAMEKVPKHKVLYTYDTKMSSLEIYNLVEPSYKKKFRRLIFYLT